jgi:hypothetical protein
MAQKTWRVKIWRVKIWRIKAPPGRAGQMLAAAIGTVGRD